MANELIASYYVGDWVHVAGYGVGYLVSIEYVPFEYDEDFPQGEDDPDGEIEFTVKLKDPKTGSWEDYYADLEDLSPVQPVREIDRLLDFALMVKDYEWCKELAKQGAKLPK